MADRATRARSVERRYRGDTLVLETDFDTADGSIRLIDFMPPRTERPHLVRIVEGLSGRVHVKMDWRPRFDYGHIRPRIRLLEGSLVATAGPDSLRLTTPARTRVDGFAACADVEVAAGDRVPFVLRWHPSHEPATGPIDPFAALGDTESYWTEWLAACTYEGPWQAAVTRSLLTLKALTYAPTGAIVAAPTTSLPEQPGGVRNWDYRYTWLREPR